MGARAKHRGEGGVRAALWATTGRSERAGLELALRAAGEALYHWNIADGTIAYSEAAYRVLGMPRSMKAPRDWRARVHPDDLAAYDAALVAHLERRTGSLCCDYRYRARGGDWRWARQRGIALRDKSGRATGIVGSIADITDLKRAQEARRQSEERFDLAMRAVNEGVYEWNILEGTAHYSDRILEAVGLARRQLRNAADWYARIHPDDRPRYDAALVAHFKGRTGRFECDFRYRSGDGAWRWARQHGVAIRDASGRAVRMIGSTGDITALKLAEQESRLAHEETKAALERQTATAEILQVIRSSRTDVQPVFDAIARSALRLFGGHGVGVLLAEGDRIQIGSAGGILDLAHVRARYPVPLNRETASGRAILDRAVVNVGDSQAREMPALMRELGRALDYRSICAAPMMRNGEAIGAIAVVRKATGAFADWDVELLRTFADQAAIAIENTRLFNDTKRSNAELKRALEFQEASGDILASISRSIEDAKPVFGAIVQNGTRLLHGHSTALLLIRDGQVHLDAYTATTPEGDEGIRKAFPTPLEGFTTAARVARERRTIAIEDVEREPEVSDAVRETARARGWRSALVVPLLRPDDVLGVLSVTRREPGSFAADEVALLETFAAQAVIAIENARLFKETKEALERQTATAEILKVISRSQADIQPVFDAIITNAARLSESSFGMLFTLADGIVRIGAAYNQNAQTMEAFGRAYPTPVNEDNPTGECLVRRAVLNIPDIESAHYSAAVKDRARIMGYRSVLVVPLLKNGEPIGCVAVGKPATGAFPEAYVGLLRTFAAQAVIAIENARLFNETKEALEQQTASAEVLSVISSSMEDTSPVFKKILERCQRLFEGNLVGVTLARDDNMVELAAYEGEHKEDTAAMYPMPLSRESGTGCAILDRCVAHFPDIEEGNAPPQVVRGSRTTGFRSIVFAPMLFEDRGIGAIWVARRAGGPFSDKQIALLKTFADQAVIAIQNARLFNETKESLERQTATAEILKVISSSPTDTQPVFDAIAANALRLCEGSFATVTRCEADRVRLAALAYQDPEKEATIRAGWPVPVGDTNTTTRAIARREVVQIPDVLEDPDYRFADLAKAADIRSVVAVPMIRDGNPIGTITVSREQPGTFSDHQVGLLRTFASQAVIAIENVRLFNETKEALEQQKASGEVLAVISSSIADTKPVFDKILDRCVRLLAGRDVGINIVADDGRVHIGAYKGVAREKLEAHFPAPLDMESGSGAAILQRQVLHTPDCEAPDVPDYVRRDVRILGNRAILFAPMMWEGRGVGVIFVARPAVGPFSDKEIALLRSFADQAAIAIQNAKLFREIQEKSAQLEVANRHKSEFLANMSHELRTPLNAVIGFSEVLLEGMFGPLNEKQLDYLKDIHSSGRHLLSLINDILDLSKIEAGRMELDLADFDIAGALANALALVRERAQRHGIALEVAIAPGLGSLRADERKFRQILLNLLSNAVKFTPEGGRVQVSARRDGDEVEVAVADTGIGIAPEDHQAVFEEFRQVGRDYTRKAEGTGLGLALTRRFVELHGGTIRLQSAPGKGSTFTFTIPVRA
jgi:PAS domain S-box-containing protein